MTELAATVPYEKQSEEKTNRGCGAACLSMVYRSFGKEVPQAEIWPATAKANRFGSIASTTHLMAQDALNRGFAALAIQARHPLHVLRLCAENKVRAILNHRLYPDGPAGHYTVLVSVDDEHVVLHDPYLGPSRTLSHQELLELWSPYFDNSEIVGNVLIAVARREDFPEITCELCRTAIPASVDCPRCKKPVGLRPHVVLGCINDACIARVWENICCPVCDYLWGSRLLRSQSAASSPGPEVKTDKEQDPLQLGAFFAAFDKFCNHVLSVPAAANNPDIKKHLDLMNTRRAELKQLQVEAFAHLKVRQEQMSTLMKKVQEKKEAHSKKMDELNRPVPELDGNALGRALLKNLGFKD